MTSPLPAPFDRTPWNDGTLAVPEQAASVSTMLTEEEGRLLYWLARDYAKGDGAIVDLGCFAGGSTARLAAGTADAGRDTPVHAYDHFLINDRQKQKFLYPSGIQPFTDNDMLPAVVRRLAPWRGAVRLHRGDIRASGWDRGPIEILFIDAAKTPATTDYIARTFMPHLIPGHSLVVQQDYLHWRQPWVPAQMERMSDCFELVAWCREGTVAFRLTNALTPDALEAAKVDAVSDSQLLDHLRAAMGRFPDRAQRAWLATAMMGVADNPGIRAPYRMKGDRFTPERLEAILAKA